MSFWCGGLVRQQGQGRSWRKHFHNPGKASRTSLSNIGPCPRAGVDPHLPQQLRTKETGIALSLFGDSCCSKRMQNSRARLAFLLLNCPHHSLLDQHFRWIPLWLGTRTSVRVTKWISCLRLSSLPPPSSPQFSGIHCYRQRMLSPRDRQKSLAVQEPS